MKRLAVCLLVLLGAVILCQGTARAEEYELVEVGIRVELPENCVIITRDTPEGDPAYMAFGLDKETADNLFEQNNAYLSAVSLDWGGELNIAMTPVQGIKDLSWVDESTLKVLEDRFRAQMESMGRDYIRGEVYYSQQMTFIKFYNDLTQNGNSYHGVSYCTVHNGRSISVNYFSYIGEITEADETLLREVVDSVRLEETLDPEELAEPWEYTDPESGLSFTMPAGWLRQEQMETDEIIKMVAAYQMRPGLVLQYGSVDMWSQMSASERRGRERRDMDQSVISREDIAEIYQLDADDISTVFYGGKAYYMAWVNMGSVLGIDLNGFLDRTLLVRVENGVFYQFVYSAQFADPQFKELKSILDSARYPEEEGGSAPSFSAADTGSRDTWNGEMYLEDQIMLLVITFAVIGVAALLVWDWNRRNTAKEKEKEETPAEEPRALTPAEPAGEEDLTEGDIQYCSHCGAKISLGARFCHQCGIKLYAGENEGGKTRLKYYTDHHDTPLAFHAFVKWVALPLAILTTIGNLVTLSRSATIGGWADVSGVISLVDLVLLAMALVGLACWEGYGWMALMAHLGLAVGCALLMVGICALEAPDDMGFVLGRLLAILIYSGLVGLYYMKRRNLFYPKEESKTEEIRPPVEEPSAACCRHCGEKLLPGSCFCPSCGARSETEPEKTVEGLQD